MPKHTKDPLNKAGKHGHTEKAYHKRPPQPSYVSVFKCEPDPIELQRQKQLRKLKSVENTLEAIDKAFGKVVGKSKSGKITRRTYTEKAPLNMMPTEIADKVASYITGIEGSTLDEQKRIISNQIQTLRMRGGKRRITRRKRKNSNKTYRRR